MELWSSEGNGTKQNVARVRHAGLDSIILYLFDLLGDWWSVLSHVHLNIRSNVCVNGQVF